MDRLYIALPDRVAVVDVDVDADGDAQVRRTTRPIANASLQCVAVSPANEAVVCCGTADHGLFLSTDAADSWDRVDGIDEARVTSVTAAPTDDGGVRWWAGTEPSRVYRSTDARTWTGCDGLTDLPSSSSWAFPPRPHTHHVRWIQVDPHDPDHCYVAVEAGALVQSHDGGESWEDRVDGSRYDTHSMTTHPDAPDRAYCAAGDGYAETTDGGATWEYPQEGLDHRYCWSIVVDPTDPDHRLLSSARGAMRAHRAGSAESYLYRRRGGEPWERVDGLPTGDGVTRYVLGVGSAGFYAVSNTGLFHAFEGETWARLPLSVSADATVGGLAVSG
jgi:photosystem II stability/assembly factor-like uncharacterized protein